MKRMFLNMLAFSIFAGSGCVSLPNVKLTGDSKDFTKAVDTAVGGAKDIAHDVATTATTASGSGGVTIVNNNNTNVNISNNVTVTVTVNIVQIFDVKGYFTGALDASQSIKPEAMTSELKTNRLVIFEREKGVWAFNPATASQQVQSIEGTSGAWEKLPVDVGGSVSNLELGKLVNGSDFTGQLRSMNQASNSIVVRGIDGNDLQLRIPGALLYDLNHNILQVSAEDMANLVTIIGDASESIAVMGRNAHPAVGDKMFYQYVSLLESGRAWDMNVAAKDDSYDSFVWANGKLNFHTTTGGKHGIRALTISQITGGGV